MSYALLLLVQAYPDPSGDESVWPILNLFLCTFSHSCMASFSDVILETGSHHAEQTFCKLSMSCWFQLDWSEQTLGRKPCRGVCQTKTLPLRRFQMNQSSPDRCWQVEKSRRTDTYCPLKSTLISRIFDVFPSTQSNKCVAIFITQTYPSLQKVQTAFLQTQLLMYFTTWKMSGTWFQRNLFKADLYVKGFDLDFIYSLFCCSQTHLNFFFFHLK